MKKWQLLVALTGSMMIMAPPAAAQKRPPPPKPSISAQKAASSARQAASKAQVSSGKAVARRGMQSLRAQKANLVRLIGRAEGLKPARFQLRQQTIDARRAYRANPNSANRAAWRAAVRSYLPVRQAHETARGQRDAALFRYKQTKLQRESAMKSAARAAPAATPPRLPPQPGRPAIRRQAAVRQLPIRATAAASPQMMYQTSASLPRPRVLGQGQGQGNGNYFSSAAAFRASLPPGSNYTVLTPAEAGLGRQSTLAGTQSAGGTAGSFSASGTLPTIRLTAAEGLPTINLVQNAAGGN